MFFLLTLPFRIFLGVLFGILFLPVALLFVPFLILRLVIKAAVLLLVMPFALMATFFAAGLAFVIVACVLLAPLLPFIAVALIVWAIVRASRPAVSY